MVLKEQILWTAVVTPFDAQGQIDKISLEQVLFSQAQAGNGIILLGSTGEALALSDSERRFVVETALALNLPTSILVGVPAHNHRLALDWIKQIDPLPIDGYLMTTPIYAKPGIDGQTEWFRSLLGITQKPVLLYNIPSRAGSSLYPETVKALADYPNLGGIKDSSGTIETVMAYEQAAPNIPIFCGDDYLMPSFATVGAVGLVSVASNVWPNQVRNYVAACLNRQPFDYRLWWQATRALFLAPSPAPVKILMADLGIISTPTIRLPLSLKDFTAKFPNTLLLDYHNQIIQTTK